MGGHPNQLCCPARASLASQCKIIRDWFLRFHIQQILELYQSEKEKMQHVSGIEGFMVKRLYFIGFHNWKKCGKPGRWSGSTDFWKLNSDVQVRIHNNFSSLLTTIVAVEQKPMPTKRKVFSKTVKTESKTFLACFVLSSPKQIKIFFLIIGHPQRSNNKWKSEVSESEIH